jgi:RNA polymerase-binding protein DksA
VAKASSKKAPKAAPKAAKKIQTGKKTPHAKPVAAKVVVKPQKVAQVKSTKPVISKPAKSPAKPSVIAKPVRPSFGLPSEPERPMLVPSPPTADGKPRKNQAGLSQKELEHYRELLLLKRRELVGDMSAMEREALRTAGGSNLSNLPLHMADMGTDNYEQEFTLGLVEKDRQLLREINNALAKIQNGLYGLCEGTGKPISKPRLEAQPWAKYSIEYARLLEQRQMIRR